MIMLAKVVSYGGNSVRYALEKENAKTVKVQGGRIKMRSPPKVLTGNFRPSQLSFFLS